MTSWNDLLDVDTVNIIVYLQYPLDRCDQILEKLHGSMLFCN